MRVIVHCGGTGGFSFGLFIYNILANNRFNNFGVEKYDSIPMQH